MIIPTKTLRLIDANINRAMEGLRVVEDIARFELDENIITSRLKNLRSDFKKAVISLGIPGYELLHARDSRKDVGADMYSEGEAKRSGLDAIITSNFKRVEESLRVLEEAVKLLGSKFGRDFKRLRYRVYDLEKKFSSLISRPCLAGRQVSSPISRLSFNLYVITDRDFSLGRSHEEIVKLAIKGGAKIIQYRDKRASGEDYFRIAKKLAGICCRAGVTFIVNDHIDVAKAVNADGVHIGQQDIPVKVAREILGQGKLIGVSVRNLKEALSAEKEGADYIGFGPVFPTLVKKNTKPLGLKLLSTIRKRVRIPVVAIGGIDASNINKVRALGIKKIAVVRAVVGEKNVAGAVRRLTKKLR